MHDIRYDPLHDEILVPQQFGQAILTFRGDASGEEPPVRIIQGPLTQLLGPDKVEVDPVHDEIFVPQGGSVLVFPRRGNGDVAPLRILRGPDSSFRASAVAVDPVHDLLVVASSGGRRGPAALLLFNRTDEGTAKPRTIITGTKTGLDGPLPGLANTHQIQVYPPRGWIVVSQGLEPPTLKKRGIKGEVAREHAFVGVWSIQDNGDVPPRWRIGGPGGILQKLMGVTLDPRNKTVIVSDKYLNALLTYYAPEIF